MWVCWEFNLKYTIVSLIPFKNYFFSFLPSLLLSSLSSSSSLIYWNPPNLVTAQTLLFVCLFCSVMSDSLWTHGLAVACQAPLSMGIPRLEYWSGLPFPPPGDLYQILYHRATWEAGPRHCLTPVRSSRPESALERGEGHTLRDLAPPGAALGPLEAFLHLWNF